MRTLRLALTSSVIVAATAVMTAQISPGWTPVLELRIVSASPSGDRISASNSWKLVGDADPIAATLATSSTLCYVFNGGQTMELPPSATDNVWKLSGTFEGIEGNVYRIRMTSQFTRLSSAPLPAPSTQLVSLKEGDEVTLDTIRAAEDGPCHVRNLLMRARVVMRANDAATQAARYTADVWLVHDDGVGAERRQHIAVNVDGSDSTSFSFNSMGFQLPQLSPLQGNLEAFIQVGGALRARARSDGLIDLDVDTDRQIGLHDPSVVSQRPFPGARGHKSLTLKDDETIAIDLPVPNGYSMHALTPVGVGGRLGARQGGAATANQPPSVAVEVRNGSMVLRPELFFKTHRTQLLIRLHKTRE